MIKVKGIFTAIALILVPCAPLMAHHELIVVPDDGGHSTPVKSGSPSDNTRHSHRNAGHRHTDTSHRRTTANIPAGYLTPYIGVGIGTGGQEIGRFEDSFGEVETVRSGGGYLFEGGLVLAIEPYTHLRATGGIEVDSVSRSNGRSTFDRVRFDLMMLRKFHNQDLGVGLTAHTGVEYRCDINSICAGNVQFEPALGYTIEYALTTFGLNKPYHDSNMSPLRDARLGIRFTDIEYLPSPGALGNDPTSAPVDGKSLTAFLGFTW